MTSFLMDFLKTDMAYTTWTYFVLVAAVFAVYYILPRKTQWIVLLSGSGLFYYLASGRSKKICALFLLTIIVSYIGGTVLDRNRNKLLCALFLVASTAPLLAVKGNVFISRILHSRGLPSLIVPLGLSFYSLQIYSYLFDVYKERIKPQKNFFKYCLYVSYFPLIMQGPISRYEQLGEQLYEGHPFDPDRAAKGFQLVIWGFFLKYMIAEKAAVIVNTVFNNHEMYQGIFALAAGILYSIQLYADFLACVCMCRGVSEALGIDLAENFMQPYRARSIRDFWRRWHISLSSWLRDYVYIPLGGSRKGEVRKYINLLLTFLVSGIWHGNGFRFIAWGLLHAVYQILGDLLRPVNRAIKRILGIGKDTSLDIWIDRVVTFTLVMFAWIIFRANTLTDGLEMIKSIFTVRNTWVLFDDSLLALGLDWKEIMLMIISIQILFMTEARQEKMVIRDRIMKEPLLGRWILYLAAIAVIIIFGTYGYGFDSSDFIYRGF